MKNILITSLVADALSLGSHWICSQREIADKFGSITGYSDPATSYHPGKQAGDFTHLLLRHPDDVVAALTANVEAGGDSAARGMIIGMVHGAKSNGTPLPKDWLTGLHAYGEIQQLIETISSHV